MNPLEVLREVLFGSRVFLVDGKLMDEDDARAALDAVEALAEALRWLGWDIGEEALCWCPDHWFDTDETGARRVYHSAPCEKARAALARFPATSPAKEQT